MSYIVLLTGIPAAGKTRFPQYLSKELSIPIFSKDAIKEVLFDDLGFRSREEKIKLGIASMHIMYAMAEECMRLNKDVILENNFEDISKPRLQELIQKYDYKSIVVRFEGNISKIFDRFVQREQSVERHLGHVLNQCYPVNEPYNRKSSITLEQFENSIRSRGIDNFDMGGELILVDTSDLSNVNYNAIFSSIKANMV